MGWVKHDLVTTRHSVNLGFFLKVVKSHLNQVIFGLCVKLGESVFGACGGSFASSGASLVL